MSQYINYPLLPDSITHFFRWTLPEKIPLPKTQGGLHNFLIGYNLFQKRSSAAWHVLPDSVYPHTLNYRLIRSICDNDINELKLCLDSNPELANAAIYQGYKPLTLAASLNRSGLIDYLVLRGADIEEVDSQGRTPLIQAVINWQIESIKSLVEKGADINKKGKYGYSAVDLAQKKGYGQLQNFLEIKEKEQIEKTFPDIQIEFQFEKTLINQNLQDFIMKQKQLKFTIWPYPFNDFQGRYKVNYLSEQ